MSVTGVQCCFCTPSMKFLVLIAQIKAFLSSINLKLMPLLVQI